MLHYPVLVPDSTPDSPNAGLSKRGLCVLTPVSFTGKALPLAGGKSQTLLHSHTPQV